MPSLAITQPYATKSLDLIDATDRSYRQLESAYAMAIQIQKAAFDLRDPDGNGVATAGTYLMPISIDEANRAAYEAQVDAVIASAAEIINSIGAIMAL